MSHMPRSEKPDPKRKKHERVYCVSCRPHRLFEGPNAAEYCRIHQEDHKAKK